MFPSLYNLRMRRVAAAIALLAASLCCSTAEGEKRPTPLDRVWYVPNPGTLDLLRMFEHPEEWTRARQLIAVPALHLTPRPPGRTVPG